MYLNHFQASRIIREKQNSKKGRRESKPKPPVLFDDELHWPGQITLCCHDGDRSIPSTAQCHRQVMENVRQTLGWGGGRETNGINQQCTSRFPYSSTVSIRRESVRAFFVPINSHPSYPLIPMKLGIVSPSPQPPFFSSRFYLQPQTDGKYLYAIVFICGLWVCSSSIFQFLSVSYR